MVGGEWVLGLQRYRVELLWHLPDMSFRVALLPAPTTNGGGLARPKWDGGSSGSGSRCRGVAPCELKHQMEELSSDRVLITVKLFKTICYARYKMPISSDSTTLTRFGNDPESTSQDAWPPPRRSGVSWSNAQPHQGSTRPGLLWLNGNHEDGARQVDISWSQTPVLNHFADCGQRAKLLPWATAQVSAVTKLSRFNIHTRAFTAAHRRRLLVNHKVGCFESIPYIVFPCRPKTPFTIWKPSSSSRSTYWIPW